ncbi:hypothetical protein AX14_010990 [Amanita brunnescens Koide BX004]|nr:hypothetical protein AX14_010990 [Amanita brunnescens Koide BX004]
MRRVEGPLATGTYIVITRLNNEDQLATSKARKNGIGYEMLTTKNRNDENIEWYFECLGNDYVRAYNKKSRTSFIPSSYAEGVLLDQESEPVVFIMRETETKGEYVVTFAENTSWYICPLDNGSAHKLSKEPARWSFLEVDI